MVCTVRGNGPFFSPDGEWLGFSNGEAMLKVSVRGGPPVGVAEAPGAIRGATWGTDDHIIFGTTDSGLLRVSAGGGELEPLTALDSDLGEATHAWPSVIPDREAVLFVISTGNPLEGTLAVLDLEMNAVTRLELAGVGPRYVSTGHLLYAAADGTLMAVPFDASRLEVTGNAVPLVEGIYVAGTGAANFSVSDQGHLLYGSEGGGAQRGLVWVERDGTEEHIPVPPRTYGGVRISPDGGRLAVDIRDQENDIWIWDLTAETLERLTTAVGEDEGAQWTPDGQSVIFTSTREGPRQLFRKAANNTSAAERLVGEEHLVSGAQDYSHAGSFTPDGSQLIFRGERPGTGNEILAVSLDGEHTRDVVLSTAFDEKQPNLSRDGLWLAYVSNSSGQDEVYVRPFPDVGSAQRLISTAGGREPLWAPDNSELFYLAGDQLMSVRIETESGFTPGVPEVVIEGPYFFGGDGPHFDVGPDGRFLMIRESPESGAASQIKIVLNWFQELTEFVRVP